LPKTASSARVPVFVTLSFTPVHTLLPDKSIPLSTRWVRGDKPATEADRGTATGRWPWPLLLGNGFAVAVAYYGDLFEDRTDGLANSVIPGVEKALAAGTPRQEATAWNAIGAWAWGMSRMQDLVEKEPRIDARRSVLVGHSRLGKTSLWAGVADERFGIVVSNDSGEGGAALARRRFGETTARITTVFPHWFAPRLREYAGREHELPVDQHMLLALVAPRPLYVASATEDLWADPRGEFLAAQAAEPVYRLLGREGLGVADLPSPDRPVGGAIGYHLRTGKHALTAYDWEQYLDFADRHLRAEPASSR
jgi:hypothetical protein